MEASPLFVENILLCLWKRERESTGFFPLMETPQMVSDQEVTEQVLPHYLVWGNTSSNASYVINDKSRFFCALSLIQYTKCQGMGSLCHHIQCVYTAVGHQTWHKSVSVPSFDHKGVLHITDVCVLCLDDEEALNSIMKDLAALGRCYTQHNKPKNRTLLYKQVHVLSSIRGWV